MHFSGPPFSSQSVDRFFFRFMRSSNFKKFKRFIVCYSLIRWTRMSTLDDEEVIQVLEASENTQKKRKATYQLVPTYRKKKQRQAKSLVDKWTKEGIPFDVADRLRASNENLLDKFGWKVIGANKGESQPSQAHPDQTSTFHHSPHVSVKILVSNIFKIIKALLLLYRSRMLLMYLPVLVQLLMWMVFISHR